MKKIFAIVLALTLIFALVPFSALNVSAASKTQDEAVAWIAAAEGKYWDYDGSYGAQCVDLICYYYQFLGYSSPGGNAVDYITNALPSGSGWQRIQYYSGFVAQPGDIAIFNKNQYSPTYGHIGLVLSATSSGMTTIENNVDGTGASAAKRVDASKRTYTNSMNFWGVIRPSFSGSPTPDPVYENIAEDTYVIKNNNNGLYMCVSYGADVNGQNVDMYNEINGASKMVITKASTGYKIRPECCASRLINPYGYSVTSGLNVNIYDDENDSTQWWQFQKVSGGYVIRNVQNPDCVLDTDGGNVFVSSYTGASTQIWSLISTHVHSYGSWKVKSSATCTSNGTEYRTCSCGAEETRTISALGHNYTSATTKPTCTSGGYTTYTCSRCSHSYTGNSTSAKGHTPGAAATCTSAQTCTTCGVVLANAKGHTPGAAATCTSAQTCTTCGVVLANAKGHTPGAAATCTSAQTCTTCGVVLANAKGHTPGAPADCYTEQICTSCGVVLNTTTEHDYGITISEPTCTTDGYATKSCSICGECFYSVIEAPGHTEGEWETLPDGSKELHCTVCGELLDSGAAPSYKEGDITGDGKVNMFDYVKLKSCYLDKTSFTDEERIRADITGDGKVNIFDYMRLKVLVLIG